MEQELKQPKLYGPLATIAITLGIFFGAQIIGALIFVLGYTLYVSVRVYGADLSHFFQSLKAFVDVLGTFELKPLTVFFEVFCIEAVTLWTLHLILKYRKLNFHNLGLNKPQAKHIAYALAGFGVYFVLYILGIIAAKALIPSLNIDQKQEIGFSAATKGIALVPVFLSLVILPPFTEEIVARGFLFGGLRTKLPFASAAVITSTLFAAAHLGEASNGLLWVAAVDTFILSLVLCYLREKTGSLWPSIGVHALKNGLAFIVLFNIVQYFK